MEHPSGLDGTPTEVHLERDEILIFYFLLLRTRTLFWIVSLLLNLEVSADNPFFFFSFLRCFFSLIVSRSSMDHFSSFYGVVSFLFNFLRGEIPLSPFSFLPS